MNRVFILATAAIFILSCSAFAISFTGNNTFEFRLAGDDSSDSFLEDRFNLRVSESFVTLGARFEAMHPSRASAITRPSEEYDEITQRWATIDAERIEITVGTFMATLGNGFVLDARERSEIQQDHHLDGVSADFELPSSDLTILAGAANWNYLDDFSIKGFDLRTSDIPYLNLGASYIAFDDEVHDPDSILDDLKGEIWGANIAPEIGPFYAEAQYSASWRSETDGGDFQSGDLIYGNASAFAGPIVIFGEYLQAEDFIAEGYGDNSQLVTLPLIVHQPSYTLMSRHLAEIDPMDTRAFGGELSYSFGIGDAMLSAASVGDIDGEADGYLEIYGSTYLDFESLSGKIVAEYQDFPGDDEAINIVVEPLYYLNERASILLDIEFQTGVEYGEDVTNYYGLMEFALSPYGSAGIEGGSISSGDGGNETFGRFYLDIAVGERNKLTLAYGKRPGGFTCSGGSCRYEPEFDGFEFKLVSSF